MLEFHDSILDTADNDKSNKWITKEDIYKRINNVQITDVLTTNRDTIGHQFEETNDQSR